MVFQAPWLGVVVGLLASLGVTPLALRALSKRKAGRPTGYYQQVLRQMS